MRLGDLSSVPWRKLQRVYGNFHCVLIGLLAEWWVDLDSANWVLEGAPAAFGRKPVSDAILCDRSGPVGVLEVEGVSYLEKLGSIATHLGPDVRPQLAGMRFGLLVIYAYGVTRAQGRSDLSRAPGVLECLEGVRQLVEEGPQREVVVVTVDKTFEGGVHPIRMVNDYYPSFVSAVNATRFVSNSEAETVTLFETPVPV